MQRPAVRTARPLLAGLVAVVMAFLVLGCASTATPTASPPPATATPPAPSPSATPIPTDAATPGPTQPGQSDTDWERIWDDLPPGFPSYPAAHPTETGSGPTSATLDAGSAKPAEVVTWYQTTLAAGGFALVSRDGPREDGSYELIVSGAGSCDIRITAAPLGGSTIITVMYGAHCPFG